MGKKEKKPKVVHDIEVDEEEEVYTLSGDEPDKEILEQMNYKGQIFYHNDFNLSLDKIKSLKELLNEENTAEKPTQAIIDALAEKISEMIKELK